MVVRVRGTDKLRKRFNTSTASVFDDDAVLVARACDEIERELEREYVRLPVDADGVPVRIGDKLAYHDAVDGCATVIGMCLDEDGRWIVTCRYTHHDCHTESYKELKIHCCVMEVFHHHEPTLEDVLRDFAGQVTNGQRIHGAITLEKAIPECIAKIREVMADE